ncbi:hypothetical protein DMENIID0001_059450 [Sergentomyia squamirostris]
MTLLHAVHFLSWKILGRAGGGGKDGWTRVGASQKTRTSSGVTEVAVAVARVSVGVIMMTYIVAGTAAALLARVALPPRLTNGAMFAAAVKTA